MQTYEKMNNFLFQGVKYTYKQCLYKSWMLIMCIPCLRQAGM
jgi:hypothetical protein